MGDIKKLFYGVLMTILGYDPSAAYQSPPVRHSWPTNGQPDWNHGDEVIFLQAVFMDGQDVSRPLHEFLIDDGAQDLIRHQEQTRVLKLQLIAYGAGCVEKLDTVRTAIYNGIPALREAGVHVVPGEEAPVYAPELFQARWWERADMQMIFNVGKSYDTAIKTITSVNVTLNANRPLESETVISEVGIFIKKE